MIPLIAITVASMAIGLVLCVPVGLALWTVLGESHFVLRLAGLLACIAAVGVFFADNPSGQQLARSFAYAMGFLFVGSCLWLFRHRIVQCIALLMLGNLIWLIWREPGIRLFDPESFAATSIAILMSASIVFTFRVLGFRFIRLTGDASDTEVERGTGMNLDGWLAVLREAGGDQMNRSELVAFLRERGVPFSWQVVIANAQETSIGRRILGVSAEGRPETVIAHSQIGMAAVSRDDVARFRWTIKQLFVLSAVAAGLFGLARWLSLQVPSMQQLFMIAIVSLSCVIISVPVLVAELSVDRRWINRVVYLVVALVLAVLAPLTLGLVQPQFVFIGAILSMLFYTAWLVAAVTLVRHEGYRIILAGHPGKVAP